MIIFLYNVVTQYIHKETFNKTFINKRVINDVTKKGIIKDLENLYWDEILAEEDVNIIYNKFVNLFTNLFNPNCPVNTSNITQGKRKTKRPDKPWMTTCLKNACKKKNMLYKQFLKNRIIEREAKYKKYKNKLTAILRYSEKQHYSNILELNKMNMKETWKILNTLINKKEKGSQYPTQFNDDARKVTGNFDIANGFNRLFSNIGPALARNIPNGNTNLTNYLNQKVEPPPPGVNIYKPRY